MFVRAGLAVGFLKQMAQGHRRTAWPHGAASALAHRRRAVWAARVVGRRPHSKRSCPTQVLVPQYLPFAGGHVGPSTHRGHQTRGRRRVARAWARMDGEASTGGTESPEI